MVQIKVRDPRQTSAARLAAAQGLYEIEITGAPLETVLSDFNDDRMCKFDDPRSTLNPH